MAVDANAYVTADPNFSAIGADIQLTAQSSLENQEITDMQDEALMNATSASTFFPTFQENYDTPIGTFTSLTTDGRTSKKRNSSQSKLAQKRQRLMEVVREKDSLLDSYAETVKKIVDDSVEDDLKEINDIMKDYHRARVVSKITSQLVKPDGKQKLDDRKKELIESLKMLIEKYEN